jgi:uncharacterized membrane protein
MTIFLVVTMIMAIIMFFASIGLQRKSFIHDVLDTCKTTEQNGKTRLISERYGLVSDWHSMPTDAWNQVRNMARRL